MPHKLQLIRELETHGITHPAVLTAIAKTPREAFISPFYQKRAYENTALPIDCHQTISQPYIVALMSQALLQHAHPQKILEIGTGSGYQAAILAQLFEQVFTIERIEALHVQAQEILGKLDYHNIQFKLGDGFKGWPEQAPFDGIIVTAATPHLPPKLIEQLHPQGGLMVIPLGNINQVQKLTLIEKKGNYLHQKVLEQVLFVPMIEDKD